MSIAPVHVTQPDNECKNSDLNLDIVLELENEVNRKKVWAAPLDLDEKTSDDDLMYYIKELMKLGRIWQAGKLAEKLPLKLQNTESIQFLMKEKQLIATRILELEDFDGWDLQVDGSIESSLGISIWWRYISGSPIIQIKSKFRIDASFENLVVIANEIDLWSMFMGKLIKVDTKVCARYGFNTSVPYLNVHFPWPMCNRESYLEMRVYDLIAEKKLCLVVFEDVGDRTEILDFKIPDVEKDSVRMKVKVLGMGKTLSWNQTDITLMFNIDLIMPVPQWLVNWLTRQVSWHIIREFQNLCSKLPEAHLERKKADEVGLYKYVEDRMGIVFKDRPEKPINENNI